MKKVLLGIIGLLVIGFALERAQALDGSRRVVCGTNESNEIGRGDLCLHRGHGGNGDGDGGGHGFMLAQIVTDAKDRTKPGISGDAEPCRLKTSLLYRAASPLIECGALIKLRLYWAHWPICPDRVQGPPGIPHCSVQAEADAAGLAEIQHYG